MTPPLRTAIILLRESGPGLAGDVIDRLAGTMGGVREICFEPAESLVAVRFDHRVTSLAEIVRSIEDAGPAVTSVAQRTR